MFAQGLMVLILFAFIFWGVWKLIGENLTKFFGDDEYVNNLEKEIVKSELQQKITKLNQLKVELKNKEAEVEVSEQMRGLENKLKELQDKLRDIELS